MAEKHNLRRLRVPQQTEGVKCQERPGSVLLHNQFFKFLKSFIVYL